MKQVFWAALCGVVVVSLAGCGAKKPPKLAVACSTHRLASGLIRTRVTVTNTTPAALRAIVYGPALKNTRFIQPRYDPANVYVRVGKQRRHYVGFVIPRVAPRHPAHVLFRLAKPGQPEPILASSHSVVQVDSWDVISNDGCTVK